MYRHLVLPTSCSQGEETERFDHRTEHPEGHGGGHLDGPASTGHLAHLGGKSRKGGKHGPGGEEGGNDGLVEHRSDGEGQQGGEAGETVLGGGRDGEPAGVGGPGGLDVDDVGGTCNRRSGGSGACRGHANGQNGGLLRHWQLVLPQQFGRGQAGQTQDLEGILPLLLLTGGVAAAVVCGIGRILQEPVPRRGDAIVLVGGRVPVGGGGRRRCLLALSSCLAAQTDAGNLALGGVVPVHALVPLVDELQVLVELELLRGGVVVPGGDLAAAVEQAPKSGPLRIARNRRRRGARHVWRRIGEGGGGRSDGAALLPLLGRRLVLVALAVSQAGLPAVGRSCHVAPARAGGAAARMSSGARHAHGGDCGGGTPRAERLDAAGRCSRGQHARRGDGLAAAPRLSSRGGGAVVRFGHLWFCARVRCCCCCCCCWREALVKIPIWAKSESGAEFCEPLAPGSLFARATVVYVGISTILRRVEIGEVSCGTKWMEFG